MSGDFERVEQVGRGDRRTLAAKRAGERRQNARGPAPWRGPRRSASRRRSGRRPSRGCLAPPSPSASRPCWRRRARGRRPARRRRSIPRAGAKAAPSRVATAIKMIAPGRRSFARPKDRRAKNAGRRSLGRAQDHHTRRDHRDGRLLEETGALWGWSAGGACSALRSASPARS